MRKDILILITLLAFSLPSCAFQTQVKVSDLPGGLPLLSFTEDHKDFKFEQKNLRKWDTPVLADLDQDGYVDLLLNDHGFGVSVCWNNKGIFASPYDIIMGDLHGMTVGDYNRDGLLEIAISRGGGSGSNARNTKIYQIDKERNFNPLPEFEAPLELMRGRTVMFLDGDNDGDLDLLNFAFPDKDKKGQSENYIYNNNGKGQLILTAVLPPSKTDGQKSLVTDYNGDGILDILLYGHNRVKAFKGNGDLSYTEETENIFPYDLKDVTSISEIDFDNDGDFDLFFTCGKEFEKGETFYDPESKTWGFFSKRGKSEFLDLEVGDVLNLENLQSQWPFNDAYYIGETGYEYEFLGETHSGKNIRLVNSDALGFPDVLNEKGGIHIGYVGNKKWRVAIDTWSPTTGVIQGVNQYPESSHSQGISYFLLENRNGKFVDVTERLGLNNKLHTMGAAVADLDNNGLQDLIITQRGDLIHKNEALILINQGRAGFVKLRNHGIVTSDLGSIGMGIAAIDYNKDGAVDVIAGNERGKWHLFKNKLDSNNKNDFVIIEIGNSKSNKASALGALIKITSCGVEQSKRVGGTSANYSLSFNNFVHFGLGTCNEAVQVEVTWTNGEVVETFIKDLNKQEFIGRRIDKK